MTIEEANTPGTPRSLAKQDMIPITALLVILKEETNISPEEYERLRAKQREYSNAVGILNKGILDHNR